jgi:hypothetical protein
MWHAWRRTEVYKTFWWRSLRGKRNLEDLEVDGRILLKRILNK